MPDCTHANTHRGSLPCRPCTNALAKAPLSTGHSPYVSSLRPVVGRADGAMKQRAGVSDVGLTAQLWSSRLSMHTHLKPDGPGADSTQITGSSTQRSQVHQPSPHAQCRMMLITGDQQFRPWWYLPGDEGAPELHKTVNPTELEHGMHVPLKWPVDSSHGGSGSGRWCKTRCYRTRKTRAALGGHVKHGATARAKRITCTYCTTPLRMSSLCWARISTCVATATAWMRGLRARR